MDNKSVLKRLLKYLYGSRRLLFGAFTCTVITVGASLSGPLLIGKAIDAIGRKQNGLFLSILVALAAVYLVSSVLSWQSTFLLNKLAQRTVNRLRRELMDKLNRLPVKAFDKTPHGDFISRMVGDADTVTDGLIQGLLNLVSGVITIAGATVFMLVINPLMTLVVLLSAPAAYFVARYITKSTQRFFKEQAKSLGSLNAFAEEMITGHKTAVAFGSEEENIEKFSEINGELYKSGVKAQFYSSLTNPTTRLVNNITYAAVGVIGSLAAIYQGLTVGNISSFLIYANLFAKPFNEITGVLTQVQAALASAARVFVLLDLEEEMDGGRMLPKAITGDVTFRHLHFSYTPDRPLIEEFNFTAHAGEKIAIVGRTGAGKTTLVNLLMRFYEPSAGSITVDGVNIADMPRDALRRCFGMVLQDTWLYGASIRDNIAFARPEASMEEVVSAAKAAEANSFIKKLKNGYDTQLSDAADSISQGQRQLLSIARAMLANPPILILDEATSNIDTLTELKIQRALDRLMQGKTSFVIAHRLSTIQNADQIIVLEDGHIVETGRHEQLLQERGAYYAIYSRKFVNNA